MSTENMILPTLIMNDEYCRKVLPFIKPEYFEDRLNREAFIIISNFISKYNQQPTIAALLVEADKIKLNDDSVAECVKKISGYRELNPEEYQSNTQYLQDITEEWCQERSIYNAISTSVEIMSNEHKTLDKGAIPQLLTDALSVSFDSNIGHDYIEDAGERFESYRKKDRKIPFDLDYLNRATKGGVPTKTFNMILGGTNVGKTLWLCHFAAAYLAQGYDVLYITCEMASEWISQRIDQNLLNFTEDELETIPKDVFMKRIDSLKSKTNGKLVVKQYAPSTFTATHLRGLLNDLKLKKKFRPKIMIFDYLNILASAKLKFGGSVNSYFYQKSIAEEFRGVMIEEDAAGWSAGQSTRGGQNNSDITLEEVANSHGISETVDFSLAIMSDEMLEKLNQFSCKQLKNRYNKKSKNLRFLVGVDYDHMRIYDVEQTEQKAISGNEDEDFRSEPEEKKPKKISERAVEARSKKNKFSGLKV